MIKEEGFPIPSFPSGSHADRNDIQTSTYQARGCVAGLALCLLPASEAQSAGYQTISTLRAQCRPGSSKISVFTAFGLAVSFPLVMLARQSQTDARTLVQSSACICRHHFDVTCSFAVGLCLRAPGSRCHHADSTSAFHSRFTLSSFLAMGPMDANGPCSPEDCQGALPACSNPRHRSS